MTRQLAFASVLLAGLVLLPVAFSPYYIELVSKILIFVLFAMSLDLLIGHVGLFSLGHAAYFGLAAYATAILSARYGLGIWICLPAGVVVAGLAAALLAPLALRARGRPRRVAAPAASWSAS